MFLKFKLLLDKEKQQRKKKEKVKETFTEKIDLFKTTVKLSRNFTQQDVTKKKSKIESQLFLIDPYSYIPFFLARFWGEIIN